MRSITIHWDDKTNQVDYKSEGMTYQEIFNFLEIVKKDYEIVLEKEIKEVFGIE